MFPAHKSCHCTCSHQSANWHAACSTHRHSTVAQRHTCNCLTSSGLKVREPSSLMVLLTASIFCGLLMPLTTPGGTLSGSSGSGPPSPEAEYPSSEAAVPVSEPGLLLGREAAAARSAACMLKACCRGLVLPFCKACAGCQVVFEARQRRRTADGSLREAGSRL